MTAKQRAARAKFKAVVKEASKLRKKNPKLTQAQAVKQAFAISYSKERKGEKIGYSKERIKVNKDATKWLKSRKEKDKNLTKVQKVARAYEMAAFGPPQKSPKLGATKKAKYEIGDMVYSYQNKNYKAPISYKKFVPWESLSKPSAKDKFVYKLKIKDGFSNWINEESLSKSILGAAPTKVKAKKGKRTSEMHTDTKSHNVNIRVMSGFAGNMYNVRDNIEKDIKSYNDSILRIKNSLPGMTSVEKTRAKIVIKNFKNIITKLKNQLREQNSLIRLNLK
jgi:hypothetical protein